MQQGMRGASSKIPPSSGAEEAGAREKTGWPKLKSSPNQSMEVLAVNESHKLYRDFQIHLNKQSIGFPGTNSGE